MGAGCGVRPKRARSRGQPPLSRTSHQPCKDSDDRARNESVKCSVGELGDRAQMVTRKSGQGLLLARPCSGLLLAVGSSNAIAKYIARAPVKKPKSKSPPDGRRAPFASRLLLRDDRRGTPTKSSSFKTRTCRRGLHRVSGYPSTERSQLWC